MPIRSRAIRRLLTQSLALLFAGSLATPAQTTQQAIEARLKGKPLYLRGQWAPNDLKFDLAGTTSSPAVSAPFTLCGIDIKIVRLAKDHLEIGGDRVGLEFEGDSPKRVSLETAMVISISGSPGADYGPALDKVFADDLSALVASMPFYWQHYAQAHLLSPVNTPTTAITPPLPASANNAPSATPPAATATADQRPVVDQAGEPLRKIGGGVSPPVVIIQPEAEFSPEARAAKFNGLVTVQLIVNAQGLPENVHVIRGVGMGLDEAAVKAVTQYRFKPATQNGTPVPVLLNVEVNFQFFKSRKDEAAAITHPPLVIEKHDPAFPDAVKSLRYSARSVVHIVIKADGTISDPYILQPAGLGLDEEALRAVAQYKFKPATRNGTPIPSVMNIEINFQMGN